ncbi:MAG: VCBS repeat-containing protein, partial [Cyanobacteria bacterium P01_D01_bin.44]
MATTILYDPITNPDPTALGYLTYGQLPLSPLFTVPFPPAELTNTDVFEIPEFPQSPSTDGINLDTNGTFFNGLEGYEALTYFASGRVIKNETGNIFSASAKEGYAGFTNHSIDIDFDDLSSINPLTFDIDSFLEDIELTPVNTQFPVLDANKGFTLTFDLKINEEDSDANRAGFSLIVISDDRTKGIEIGFKEEGTNSDRVFAQNANLNAANTAGEDSSASLEIKNDNQYSLTFLDNGYQLKANNTLLLQGELRDYSFDPTNSDPPFPSNVNPYETPNFVFFGDNTDQGYADFTLGKISVELEDGNSPVDFPAQPDFNNDQRADLVWRNTTTGKNALWYMDGATVNSKLLINTVDNPNWQIEGVGDFNTDGNSEIVWRNYQNGLNVIWFMNGGTLESTTSIDQVISLDWQIEAVGDLDNNGSDDLIWRNYQNGKNAIWFMNEDTVASKISIDSVTNPNWDIEGVGDFNGNGKLELVWRNYQNGKNAFWSMDGSTVESKTL